MKIDQNDIRVMYGIDNSTGAVVPLRVSPITGRLLVKWTVSAHTSIGTATKQIDENGMRVGRGVTSTSIIKPLLTDPSNSGYVLVDS